MGARREPRGPVLDGIGGVGALARRDVRELSLGERQLALLATQAVVYELLFDTLW